MTGFVLTSPFCCRLRPTSLDRLSKVQLRSHLPCRARRRKDTPSQPNQHEEDVPHDQTSEPGTAEATRETDATETTDRDNKPSKRRRAPRKREGWSLLATTEEREAYKTSIKNLAEDEVPSVDLTNPSRLADGPLPTVTREQIINSCLSVGFSILVASFLLRKFAANTPDILGNDRVTIESMMSLTPSFKPDHIAIALVATILVSGARVLLYNTWKDFAVATNRSNKYVLSPLEFGDLLVVSFVPGISEEMLFRGALIPATFADWRGVLISGIVFGALHNSGGRNVAFAAWASAVGCLYGFAFLLTQDIYVPIVAHSCGNLFSAMYWLSINGDEEETSDS